MNPLLVKHSNKNKSVYTPIKIAVTAIFASMQQNGITPD